MPRPYVRDTVGPERIAPGTAVTWYEGGLKRSGRVMHNLPAVRGTRASVVIKPTSGGRAIVPLRLVTLVGDAS